MAKREHDVLRVTFDDETKLYAVAGKHSGKSGAGPTLYAALFDYAVDELGRIPTMREVKQKLFEYALKAFGGNKTDTARELELAPRTIHYWAKHGAPDHKHKRRA